MMERQFLFFLVLLAIPALTIQMCPPEYHEADGRCFFVSDVERNYEDARNDCQNRGGSLVEIDDGDDRAAALQQTSNVFPYWIRRDSELVDFYSDVEDLNCYICEAPGPVEATTIQMEPTTECTPTNPLPTEFDIEAVRSASNDVIAELGGFGAFEIGMYEFVDNLSAYAEDDGSQLANLPNRSYIIIQPERTALTYTPEGSVVTTGLFLPETRNFDPNVGLPAELPSYATTALDAVRDRFPGFSGRYLAGLEDRYAARESMDIDYDPDCPERTDVGGGFALEPTGTTLCRPISKLEVQDPVTARLIIVDITIEATGNVIWIDIVVWVF